MARYSSCRNCGNEEDGDNIYKCKECNVIYCESCGDFSLNVFGNNNWICPSCHSTSDSICLGQIESADDDDDDDDDDDSYSSSSSSRDDDDDDDSSSSSSSSSSSGGGCFITTACITQQGLSDDCYELTVLRKFRDEYVLNDPKGIVDIRHYYKVSPSIIEHINKRADNNQVWQSVYHCICNSIRLIEFNRPEEAYKVYKETVQKLIRLTDWTNSTNAQHGIANSGT